MKKITLRVHGREMSFSEEELTAILEEHFSGQKSKTVDKATQATKSEAKDKYFYVIPNSIDRSLFQEKRANAQQEWTRQIIEEAFDEVDKYPEEYAKAFKVMIPEKMWSFKTVRELKKLAKIWEIILQIGLNRHWYGHKEFPMERHGKLFAMTRIQRNGID